MTSKGQLFLCATPIGNMQDITLRVLNTLKEMDLIACEDTRQTLKLLNHYNIAKPVTSYHEHNKILKGEKLLAELIEGKKIALLSDAGMPAISDPGQDLVKKCIEEMIEITVLPGPAAVITALVLSGLSTERFAFEGFIPRSKKEKKVFFQKLAQEERTLIFYESPHRLLDTLSVLNEIFTSRRMAACRELTKKYEEVVRGNINEVFQHFSNNNIRGEFTLVVEGLTTKNEEGRDLEWALSRVCNLEMEGLSKKEAVKQAAKEAKIQKRELYEKVMKK